MESKGEKKKKGTRKNGAATNMSNSNNEQPLERRRSTGNKGKPKANKGHTAAQFGSHGSAQFGSHGPAQFGGPIGLGHPGFGAPRGNPVSGHAVSGFPGFVVD